MFFGNAWLPPGTCWQRDDGRWPGWFVGLESGVRPNKGTPKRGVESWQVAGIANWRETACDEHRKVKSCCSSVMKNFKSFEDVQTIGYWEILPRLCQIRFWADLGFSRIQVCWKLENYHPDKRMFAMVPLQELERQVQDRLQMAGCSADLSWSQILHFSTLCGTKTKLSTDGILGLQVESKECCDVKQKSFGKKHLAIKWKWSHYRTRMCEWSRHGRVLEFQTVKTEYRWRMWYYTRLSYWFAIFSYTPYFLADCSRQAQLGRLWSLIFTSCLKFREATTAKSQRDGCNDLLNRVP